jgi:hypothetical protein
MNRKVVVHWKDSEPPRTPKLAVSARGVLRASVLMIVLAWPVPSPGQQAWRVQDVQITVNNFCYNNEPYRWIREEPGRFRIFDSVNSKEILSAPANADGSVNASDIRATYSLNPYKIVVPPGSGPREFELLDLRWVCRIKAVPTGAVK